MLQSHILFDPRDEVDAVVVFPAMPLREIDPSPIPDVEHLLPFLGPLSEFLDIHLFEHPHVMRLLFGPVTTEGKMTQKLIAQVQGIEMSDGIFGVFFVPGIVRTGRVKVTIACVEVEICQGVVEGGIRSKKIVGFERELGVMLYEALGKIGEVTISPITFAGLKVVAL